MEVNAAGQIVWVSRAVELLSGRTTEELRCQDWVDLLVPEAEREATRKVCRGGVGRDRSKSHVKGLLARDGSVRSIEWTHADVESGEGELPSILCIGRDLSELQAAQNKVLEAQQRTGAVLETAVNAIITMSETCIIETVNSAAVRLFGYSADEMIGQNVSILMPQPFRGQHDQYVHSYLSTGVKKIIGIGREVIAMRKDGSVFPIDLSVGEAVLPCGKRIFTGIIRDLTERKNLEEQLLHISEQEQHRIGRDIHDDLCQQLAAIGCLAKVAYQSLLQSGHADADALQEIVTLVTQANVCAREMSRGLNPVVLDSGGLMAALQQLAQTTARIYQIDCKFTSDAPVSIADNQVAVQLYRIAQEAVANAVKHSRATKISIQLRRRDFQVEMRIKDNGTGIPDHSVPGRGTGMGLLTMSHRARTLNGRLSVEPGKKGGTVVTCIIPLSDS
ncbi:MAG: PAS domain S-box protein [Verrucomicrobiales bacterium]|nr:PAS domain S-box protein [Verrucomicrobiales bacterium]